MEDIKNDDMKESEVSGSPKILPLLPLRDIVVFPGMVVPLFVGRPRSIKALESALEGERELVISAQRQASTDEPSSEDIFRIGTIGTIVQLLRLPDETVKVLVVGKKGYLAKTRCFGPDFAFVFTQFGKTSRCETTCTKKRNISRCRCWRRASCFSISASPSRCLLYTSPSPRD